MPSMGKEILVFASHYQPFAPWREAIEREAPDVSVQTEDQIVDPRRVRYALLSQPRSGFFDSYPDLAFLINMGAGTDALLSRRDLPPIPITRIVDSGMVAMMSQYIRWAVTRYARQFDVYEVAQRERRWARASPREAGEVKVGVLGLGELGTRCASDLAADGYDVRGWSRSAKALADVRTYAGLSEIDVFLGDIEILAILLPLVPDTRDFLDEHRLARLPRGAKIINAARGAILNESALMRHLHSGQIGGATLDTFAQEPLAQDHNYWTMPNVLITPHVAAVPVAAAAASEIAANIRASRIGAKLLRTVSIVK